jgi:hypothetical protein
MLQELKDPICDLRFLLNRRYRKSTAVGVVANKYRLGSRERHLLVRAVFSEEEAEDHKRKRVPITEIKGKDVVIDGYNVLITVESALKKKTLFLSDDGFVRDTSATFGKHRITKTTPLAIERILKVLRENLPRKALFIFDSQVSFSGELCSLIREKMAEFGIEGDAKTSERADYEIITRKGIVCSSDRAIIEKVEKVVDLPRHLKPKLETLPSCKDIRMPS